VVGEFFFFPKSLVDVGTMDWDPQRTARALTDAIDSIEGTDGVFDVIIFGNESADTGGFQVGIRTARALDRPMVNAIKGVEVENDVLEARRETANGVEVYRLTMPCAIGVKEGITWPRYPTMRGRLASKKLAVGSMSSSASPGGQTKIRLNRPVETVSETVILGHGAEAAPKVIELLQELGLLA